METGCPARGRLGRQDGAGGLLFPVLFNLIRLAFLFLGRILRWGFRAWTDSEDQPSGSDAERLGDVHQQPNGRRVAAPVFDGLDRCRSDGDSGCEGPVREARGLHGSSEPLADVGAELTGTTSHRPRLFTCHSWVNLRRRALFLSFSTSPFHTSTGRVLGQLAERNRKPETTRSDTPRSLLTPVSEVRTERS